MKETPRLTASELLELLKNMRTPPAAATRDEQDEKRKPRRPSTKAGELLHTLRNRSSRRAGPFLRDA